MFKRKPLRRKLEDVNLDKLNKNNQNRTYFLVGNSPDATDYSRPCERIKKFAPNSVNMTDLNETQLELYIWPYNNRQLEEGFNLSKLNFTWEVVGFEYDYVLVQLNFTDVNYISTQVVRDEFVFKVKSNYSNLFYS
jgi:hypothetical protein